MRRETPFVEEVVDVAINGIVAVQAELIVFPLATAIVTKTVEHVEEGRSVSLTSRSRECVGSFSLFRC